MTLGQLSCYGLKYLVAVQYKWPITLQAVSSFYKRLAYVNHSRKLEMKGVALLFIFQHSQLASGRAGEEIAVLFKERQNIAKIGLHLVKDFPHRPPSGYTTHMDGHTSERGFHASLE